MKKIFSLCLVVFLMLSLAACGDGEAVTGESGPSAAAEPLFRMALPEGGGDALEAVYLPLSDGFLYVHPSDQGFSAGFVSPTRSVSAERILTAAGAPASVRVMETERDRALLFTETEAYLLFLKEGSATKLERPEADLTDGVIHPALSMIGERGSLLVLLPADLKETLVLADTAELPDFSRVLGVSKDGRRIWYATEQDGAFTGMAYFEYGKTQPERTVPFVYDRVTPLGGTAFLFESRPDDGSAVYLYRDPEEGITRSFSAKTPFDDVAVSADGTLLCGTRRVGEGGTVTVYSMETGAELTRFDSDYGHPAASPAFSADGTTLFFAVTKDTDTLFATLKTK